MDQVPLPIMIGLDDTWDKKVAMYLCVFPSQMLVLKKVFVPLNSTSVSVEYNQILHSYFGEQVGVF